MLGLDAVQAHEVGLVLTLALFQGGAVFLDLALALLTFLNARGQLVLQFLLAGGDDLMLLVEGRAFALKLFGAGLVLGLAQFQFLPNRLRLHGLRVELLLVILEPFGADAEGLLLLVEAVAAVAVALVQLLADLAQLAAQARASLNCFSAPSTRGDHSCLWRSSSSSPFRHACSRRWRSLSCSWSRRLVASAVSV